MSDTIGTVIMVGIVLLLSLIMGGHILAEYDDADADVYASVDFQNNPDDSVEVVWTGKGTADRIVVTNGTETKTIENRGESVTMWYGSDGAPINVFGEADPDRRTILSKFEPPEFNSTVYAESSTCDSPGYCGSKVLLNGTRIFSSRGVNILVFDPQGNFHSYAWYDTHNNQNYRSPTQSLDSDGTPDMNPEQSCSGCVEDYALSHIQTIPEDHYIVIIGDDQPGNIGDSLESEYERMGAEFSHDDTIEYRDSWIIVSEKVTNSATDEYDLVFERHAPRGSQSGVALVKAYFFAPHD